MNVHHPILQFTARRARWRTILMAFIIALYAFFLLPGVTEAFASNDWNFDRYTYERTHHDPMFSLVGLLAIILAMLLSRSIAQSLPREKAEKEVQEQEEQDRWWEREKPAPREGLRPVFKKPKDYGDRENVWDPSIEEQERKWDRDGVVWDPETLSWREPVTDDFPPPTEEVSTPFTEKLSRSEVPFQCLGLYDKYTLAQNTVLEMEERIKAATEEYEFAVDEYGKQYLKAILRLGYDTASIAAAGGDAAAGAGRALRGRAPTPRDLWLGPYDKLQSMLRQASQAVSAAAERLAALTRAAADAAVEALSRSKVLQGIREGLETARNKITQLRGTADTAQAKIVSLETKEAAAKQVNVLRVQEQKISFDMMSLEQQYKQLDDYIEKAQSFEQAFNKWMAANAALGLKKDRLRDVIGEITRLRKMLDNDPERYAGMITKLETEAAQLSSFVAEAEKTAKNMPDWMAANGYKDLYESVANHPVARGQNVGSMESLRALQQERARLGAQLMKEQAEAAKLQSQISSLTDTLGGATPETIGAELRETRHALNETVDAISDQEGMLSRLEGDLPRAELDIRAAESAREQADEAVRQAQQALRQAEEQVREAETRLASLGPPPAANAPMTPGMLAQIAKAWVWAFGADQGGAEIGSILMQLQTAVSERKARIDTLEAERTAKLKEMRDAKPALDACLLEHAKPDTEEA